jgi:hypothetical protein
MEQLSTAQVIAVLAVVGTAVLGGITVLGAFAGALLFVARQGRAFGALEGRLGQAEAASRAIGPMDARLQQVETGHKGLAVEARDRLNHLENQASQRDGDVRELKIMVGTVKDGVAGMSGAIEELRRYFAPAPKRNR